VKKVLDEFYIVVLLFHRLVNLHATFLVQLSFYLVEGSCCQVFVERIEVLEEGKNKGGN